MSFSQYGHTALIQQCASLQYFETFHQPPPWMSMPVLSVFVTDYIYLVHTPIFSILTTHFFPNPLLGDVRRRSSHLKYQDKSYIFTAGMICRYLLYQPVDMFRYCMAVVTWLVMPVCEHHSSCLVQCGILCIASHQLADNCPLGTLRNVHLLEHTLYTTAYTSS